jgi:hypothetical protein
MSRLVASEPPEEHGGRGAWAAAALLLSGDSVNQVNVSKQLEEAVAELQLLVYEALSV